MERQTDADDHNTPWSQILLYSITGLTSVCNSSIVYDCFGAL